MNRMFSKGKRFVNVSILTASVLWVFIHVLFLSPHAIETTNQFWHLVFFALPAGILVAFLLTIMLAFSIHNSFKFLSPRKAVLFALKASAIFGLTAISVSVFIDIERQSGPFDKHAVAMQLAEKKRLALTNAVSNAAVVTNALAVSIGLQEGDTSHFSETAKVLLNVVTGISYLEVNSKKDVPIRYPKIGENIGIESPMASAFNDSSANLLTPVNQNATLSGPVIFSSGDVGVIIRESVFNNGGYWGTVSAFLTLESLFETIDTLEIESLGYLWALYNAPADKDSLQRFAGNTIAGNRYPIRLIVDIPNGHWIIEMVPATGWIPLGRNLFAMLFILFSTFIAGIIAVKNFALPLTLVEAVKQKTKYLADEHLLLEQTQEMSKTGSWKFDLITARFYASKKFHHIFDGYNSEAPTEESLYQEHYRSELKKARRIEMLLQQGNIYDVEFEYQSRVGVKWIRETAKLQYDADSRPIAIIGACQDVTIRKAAEDAIRISEQRMDMALRGAGLGAWELTIQDKFLQCDARCFEILGYDRSLKQNVFSHFKEILYPGDFDLINAAMRIHFKGHAPAFNVDVRAKNAKGQWTWLHCTGKISAKAKRGVSVCALGTVQDITLRKAIEQRLNTLSRAIENSPVATLVTDASGTIEYVNPMFTALSYYLPKDVIGRNPRMLQSGKTTLSQYESMWKTLNDGLAWSGELWNRRKDGVEILELVSITPVTSEDNTVVNFVAVKQDITKKRHSEQAMWQQAHYDALTGLANRVYCKETAAAAFLRADVHGTQVAVLFLDLNDFKDINDAHGHFAGDRVLVHLARRLKRCVRDTDLVARIGGDEFSLILEGLHSDEEVSNIVENIHDSISSNPVMVKSAEGNPVKVSIHASIGTAIYPIHGKTYEHLLNRADNSMYSKKRLKKNIIKLV